MERERGTSLFQALAEHRIAHVLGCGLGGGADYLDAFSPRVGRPADYLGARFPFRPTPLGPAVRHASFIGLQVAEASGGYVMSSRLGKFLVRR